ncbi:MAG: choice-of-anchor D domain-containing protein [Deltaproteobacteria bacterium]|nr:choice-of-anchor D domain-containing protein [Deltaproteobacteria bacterium]
MSELPLAGTAGRPRLEVVPDVLQFSPTALGTRAFRRLRVRNTGQGLLSVATEGSAAPFEVDVQSLSVPPGTEGELEVRFSPLAVGATHGTLVLTSNDPVRPTAEVTLQGEGVLVPPCEHRLSTTALELGVVEVGRPARGTLEISNEGAGPCLLNDLRLVGADTAGFRITDARRTGRVIAVGTSTAVQVELRPTAARAYHADLELYLSSAGAERLVIPVRGEGVLVPLIVTPSELLVGPAGPGCATPRAELRLLNPSGATVRLTGARLSAPNLELEAPPDLLAGNLALAPGASVRLTVRLRPGVVGPTQAWLQVDAAGIAAPYQIAVRVLEDPEGLRRQRFEPGPSELRVLFVVADDPQFGEEQATLPAAGRRFIDLLEAAGVSYRVGVVRALATDSTCPVPLTAERPTSTLVGACGYLADGGATVGVRPEWRVVSKPPCRPRRTPCPRPWSRASARPSGPPPSSPPSGRPSPRPWRVAGTGRSSVAQGPSR